VSIPSSDLRSAPGGSSAGARYLRTLSSNLLLSGGLPEFVVAVVLIIRLARPFPVFPGTKQHPASIPAVDFPTIWSAAHHPAYRGPRRTSPESMRASMSSVLDTTSEDGQA